tara:strand:- start:12110 stop:13630 length:1521 start_codon:yes stop_codon:yes gene_type:complete
MKFALIILDGLGLRNEIKGNAFKLAHTPVFDKLFEKYPNSRLEASGTAVGLPEGVMGNSEVGHMTIGSGRIIDHDLVRINKSIIQSMFSDNPVLNTLFNRVKSEKSSLHLIGLISDAGVHSHLNHLFEICTFAKAKSVEKVYLHGITDGRDTSPTSGRDYVETISKFYNENSVGQWSTLMGRYYAMDRDKRWERTKIACSTMEQGTGRRESSPLEAVENSYQQNVTDEFINPVIIEDKNGEIHPIKKGDSILFCNFRADRMRQIVSALGQDSFEHFETEDGHNCCTMTQYDETFNFPVLFPPLTQYNILADVLEKERFRQLRVAETEKYAHVTYFFNGGEEVPRNNEKRILVPSPKVATYDLMPEMSADGIRKEVISAIQSNEYDCMVVNFANPDMVGHTGDLKATISAMETVDGIVGEILDEVSSARGVSFVTSDHGNLEQMIYEETGGIHTAHTLNPVPFFIVDSNGARSVKNGGLEDVAPTILDYFNLIQPKEMTGKSLINTK